MQLAVRTRIKLEASGLQFQGSEHSTMLPSDSLKMIPFAWRISKLFPYDSLSAAAGMFEALSLSRSSPFNTLSL